MTKEQIVMIEQLRHEGKGPLAIAKATDYADEPKVLTRLIQKPRKSLKTRTFPRHNVFEVFGNK